MKKKYDFLILAAGRGSRMETLTKDKPKCFLELFGKPLIKHLLDSIDEFAEKKVIVSGYRSESFLGLPGVTLVQNSNWNNSSMLESLRIGLKECSGNRDLVVSYSDIYLQKLGWEEVLEKFEPSNYYCPSYSNWKKLWEMRMNVPLNDLETFAIENNLLKEIGSKPKDYQEIQGQFMGILGIPKELKSDFLYHLESFINLKKVNESTTLYLNELIKSGTKIQVKSIDSCWLEMDSPADLKTYETLKYKIEKFKLSQE